MSKLFNNKTGYDPGRFRFKLTFFQQTSVPDGSGGTRSALVQLLTTRAAREPIVKRLNFLGNMDTIDGISVMQDYWYFIIRNRQFFRPAKDMSIFCNDGTTYVINAVLEVDVPVNYLKILAVKREVDITT